MPNYSYHEINNLVAIKEKILCDITQAVKLIDNYQIYWGFIIGFIRIDLKSAECLFWINFSLL